MNAWTRSPWTDAGQILSLIDPHAPPGPAAGLPPAEWYAHLLETNETSGAISFLAQALLEIGAVDRHDRIMTSVLRWIDSPDDSLRRLALAEAERESRDTPAKLLAFAVALSGGSMVPPEYPPVTVPPETCAKLAATALILAVYSLPVPADAIRTALAIGEKIVAQQ